MSLNNELNWQFISIKLNQLFINKLQHLALMHTINWGQHEPDLAIQPKEFQFNRKKKITLLGTGSSKDKSWKPVA